MRHPPSPFSSRPAESMIETIVAITVLVIGTAAALGMLRSSLEGNELVGEKVVAIQLAEEGLDALKNIRDTNYLRFPGYEDLCWRSYGATATDCSDGTMLSATQTYYLVRTFTAAHFLDWQAVPVTSASNGYLTLYSLDLGDGRDMDLYAQSGLTDPGFTTVRARAFRRTFTLAYNTIGDAYDATVTVTWEQHGIVHSVSQKGRIPNIY